MGQSYSPPAVCEAPAVEAPMCGPTQDPQDTVGNDAVRSQLPAPAPDAGSADESGVGDASDPAWASDSGGDGVGGSGGGSSTGTGGGGGYGPSPDTSSGIPQLPGPVNDAVGVGLGYCGMVPGPVGNVCTVAGGVQSLTQSTPDPKSSTYGFDRATQVASLGLGVASLAGVSAAGPPGVVLAGGVALGHGAVALGNAMEDGQRQSDDARARAGSPDGELPPPSVYQNPDWQ